MQSAVTDLPKPASGSSPSGKSLLTITSSAASTDHSIDPKASQLGGSSVRPPQQSPDSAVGYQSHQSLNVTEGGEQGPTTPRNQLTSAGLGPMILSGLGTADLTTINQQTSRQQVPSTTMSSSAPQASSIAESVISPGGSATTISGTQFSLGSVGLVVSPKILTMKLLDPTVANPAQQTSTAVPKPSIIGSEGSTIQSGGSAVILPSTSSSLAASGTPNAGGILGIPIPSVNTAASQEFTADPTAFSIMRTTVSIGGHGVTILGAIVSMASSGNVVIGSVIASSSPSVLTNAGGSSAATATVSSVMPTTVSANSL